VKIMKRGLLIVISALALAGFLIADTAWPKASIAEETPAAAAANAATPEAATSPAPKDPIAEMSDSTSQGTKVEDTAAQTMPNMPGSVEDALDQLNGPATSADSASASVASGDSKDGTEEAASEHTDAPAADENVVR
jgi:hypothetical protein